MQFFKLDKNKDISVNDRIVFSIIYNGNKSWGSIREAAGISSVAVKKHTQRLIKLGFINSKFDILIPIKTLCKWGYVNVEAPERPNLRNWISSAILVIIESMRGGKMRAAGISHACAWLGINGKRKIKRWEDKLWCEFVYLESKLKSKSKLKPPKPKSKLRTKNLTINECVKKIEKKSGELEELHIELEEARNIAKLCSLPYKEYLLTEHWREFRKMALKNAKNKCQLCNKSGKLHVHHRTYENRGCEDISDVIVLCQECHEKHHDIKVKIIDTPLRKDAVDNYDHYVTTAMKLLDEKNYTKNAEVCEILGMPERTGWQYWERFCQKKISSNTESVFAPAGKFPDDVIVSMGVMRKKRKIPNVCDLTLARDARILRNLQD